MNASQIDTQQVTGVDDNTCQHGWNAWSILLIKTN